MLRRGDKNTQKNKKKKKLNDSDNHDDVITHLKPDPGIQSQVDLRKHHYEQS